MTPALIAVDGVAGPAIVAAARSALASTDRATRGGISHWDASGVFDELAAAGAGAGQPSVRTLLLLYAADLAFRLRWEIRPALADGRIVVAAPYVETAVAFGRAAGIDREWLANLFLFAPRPTGRQLVGGTTPRRRRRGGAGFVEFALEHASRKALGATGAQLIERMAALLRVRAERGARPNAARRLRARQPSV